MHPSARTPNRPISLPHPPPASHATRLSLRGGNTRAAASVDDSFDDVDIAGAVQPPPSAFTSATAYDPYSRSPLEKIASPRLLSRERSLTDTFFDNCQPFFERATSTIQQHTSKASASFHSPTKSLASFIPSRSSIQSTASQPTIRASANALSSFVRSLNGSSAPVQLGFRQSIEEDSEEESDSEDDSDSEFDTMIAGMFSRRGYTQSPRSNETTPKRPAPTPTKSQTSPGKFSWLLNTQKNAVVPPPQPSPKYHNPDDELLNLRISDALFPHGSVDPLDPSSFHDLLSISERLLARYQSAYRAVSSELADARAEQSAQDDEMDEADTRARHLKMQLEAMAARATEQDAQMQKLKEDLAFERRARQEEEAARKRSVSLVKADSPRRQNRVSGSNVSIDSGFESDCETDATSIFSRAMSPTESGPSPVTSEVDSQLDTTPKGKKPLLLARQSTYDKVRNGSMNLEQHGWGCTNCEGGAQSAVWGRLAREREENSHLRDRIETLEGAVESALNVIDGPWGA